MRVKVLNLNTWYGGMNAWDDMLSYLKSENADILFLQEAYLGDDASKPSYLNTVSALKQLLDYPYAEHEKTFDIKVGDVTAPMGNAILSRFPILDRNVLWLYGDKARFVDNDRREDYPTFPTNLLHCGVRIGAQRYNLMTLHGIWAPDSAETESQKTMGEKIHAYVRGKQNVILGGDFNVNENTETIKLFETGLVNVFKGERRSSFNMRRKTDFVFAGVAVDFIFVSPDIKVVRHYSSEADVSDHQSQLVVLDL